MNVVSRALIVAACATLAASACDSGNNASRTGATQRTRTPTTVPRDRPLPPPVHVRATPQNVKLADPAFVALPGARADYGRLLGSVYEIEMPDRWNGKLVLFMHGYGDLGPVARVSAPDARHYLVAKGYAWAASSFSSTSMIPGRSADETAALWDFFARKYGRPARTYVTGNSMGGMATNIAAERYGNRFDGALALCGAAALTPGTIDLSSFFVAGAYAAGVTQADYDATHDPHALVYDRIVPALRDPVRHARFANALVALTGGRRAFDTAGIRIEEETNWRRSELLVAAHLALNPPGPYRLAPGSGISSAAFNRDAIRFRVDAQAVHDFTNGNETTGNLEMPLLTLHTTGDGEVPIDQARVSQRRVDAAGKHGLLVQRVVQDPGHCGFTTTEWQASFEALVAWVEHGVQPTGTDVDAPDLRRLNRTYELQPRLVTPSANSVVGATERVVLRGHLTDDGAPFDATFLGAIVLRPDGLVTPCQGGLAAVDNGAYEITVLGNAENAGCGATGTKVVLWAFVDGTQLYSMQTLAWPAARTAQFDATLSTANPRGMSPPTVDVAGEVYRADGDHVPPGTTIEAYVGATRCGLASTRRTGSYSGYTISIVGPASVPACRRGAPLTFRIGGRLARETSVNAPGHGNELDLTVRGSA